MYKSDDIRRIVTDVYDASDYEVLTDEGFVAAIEVLKIEPQQVWRLSTKTCSLRCAGDHIVFDQNFNEMYVNELRPGDLIITENGVEPVESVVNTGEFEEMYDIGIDSENHRFYSDGILSHNSLVLANLAVRGVLEGNNVGLFTVELMDRKYMKRIGSNILEINYMMYKDFSDEKCFAMLSEKIEKLKKSRDIGYLNVKEAPTGTASSIDVENYFLKIEERKKIKFDVIIVDYLNLLKPFKGGTTLYEKVKYIAEELRAIGIRNNWTMVSATQVKVHDYNSDLRLDSAAESSGLVATVDSLFGIMGEPGSSTLQIKNIANRDEGYMESYRRFVKDKRYFRIVEDLEPGSEYWSDEAEPLEKEMEKQYKEQNLIPGSDPVKEYTPYLDRETLDESFQSDMVVHPEKQKEATPWKEGTNVEGSDFHEEIVDEEIKPAVDDYDDILKNID